ncbi:MAG: Trk system potassium transporter TrkA [Muribaculaceae bacterium]
MKIVIAGAGEVGSHLAKLLTNEDKDIMVLDSNPSRLNVLDANYNLMTMEGNPSSIAAQRRARVGGCDLFIAVQPSENDNIVACSIAKNLGARTTVARISGYDFMQKENRDVVRRMGVDHLIYPEYLGARNIVTALKYPWVRNWFELHDGKIIVVGVKLRQGAPIAGMPLREFASRTHHFHVCAIRRGNNIIIPRGNDSLMTDDIVYMATLPGYTDELRELTGKRDYPIRRLMIMGGGKITARFVAMAPDDLRIKIIDNDEDVCRHLPERCPDCEISYGDARNTDLLLEEGVSECDAFIALSGSSEANILTCLSAKELGVRKTIAEVENLQYIAPAENLNIGTIINKKLLASSAIFQLMLDADSTTPKCLALADAEVAELEARPGSKIIGKPVRSISIPSSITLAAMVSKDGEGNLITGDTVIEAGDHVVVFCLTGSLHKAEKLFS